MQTGLPMTRSTYFEMCVNLECCNCQFKRSHTETFRDLSLDVLESRHNATVDIISLFTNFFQTGNKLEFKCEQKGCTSNHSFVNYRLSTVPRALILHLKRFIYDDRMRLKKRTDPVTFPILLRLKPEWFSGQVVKPSSSSSPLSSSSSSSSPRPPSVYSSTAPSSTALTHLASSVVRNPSPLDVLPDADARLKKLTTDAVAIVAREGLRLAAQFEDFEKEKVLIAQKKKESSNKLKDSRQQAPQGKKMAATPAVDRLNQTLNSPLALYNRANRAPPQSTSVPLDWVNGRFVDYTEIGRQPQGIKQHNFYQKSTPLLPIGDVSPMMYAAPTVSIPSRHDDLSREVPEKLAKRPKPATEPSSDIFTSEKRTPVASRG